MLFTSAPPTLPFFETTVVATPFEGHDDAAKMLVSPIKPIKSQFSPSYSLAVNLIARGEGKLDVARQLVGNSFAMYQKRQEDSIIEDAVEKHGEGVSEVLQASAQERFMNALIDTIQLQVDKRRANFDIARLESLLEILNDREQLKKTSKKYMGSAKMLELEQTTLGYLEKELETMRTIDNEDRELLGEIFNEDEIDLLEQIDIQGNRAVATEKEVDKHPFTAICTIANEIMSAETPEARALSDALGKARQGEDMPQLGSSALTAKELSIFSKSAIVVRRKARKLATSTNNDLDPASLMKQPSSAEAALADSWDDMRSIVKTLVAYGCLTTQDGEFPSDDSLLEQQQYSLTTAGTNLGMLGFENSLWSLAAIGGCFDVVGASSELDKFRSAMDAFDNDDDIDWYDEQGCCGCRRTAQGSARI